MATRRTDSTAMTTAASGSRSTSREHDTSGIVFTAHTKTEGGTPQQRDFSSSRQVSSGEWNPETHGEPPDVRPARSF